MRGKMSNVTFYFTDYMNKDNMIEELKNDFDWVERTNKENVYKVGASVKMESNKVIKIYKKEDIRNE